MDGHGHDQISSDKLFDRISERRSPGNPKHTVCLIPTWMEVIKTRDTRYEHFNTERIYYNY